MTRALDSDSLGGHRAAGRLPGLIEIGGRIGWMSGAEEGLIRPDPIGQGDQSGKLPAHSPGRAQFQPQSRRRRNDVGHLMEDILRRGQRLGTDLWIIPPIPVDVVWRAAMVACGSSEQDAFAALSHSREGFGHEPSEGPMLQKSRGQTPVAGIADRVPWPEQCCRPMVHALRLESRGTLAEIVQTGQPRPQCDQVFWFVAEHGCLSSDPRNLNALHLQRDRSYVQQMTEQRFRMTILECLGPDKRGRN